MNKSKREQIRERQRRQKLRSRLIWGVAGLGVLALIGYFIWQGVVAASTPPVGEIIEIPANYVDHVEVGTDPGPFPSNPPAGGSHYPNEFNAGFYHENSAEVQLPYPEGYIGHNLEHGYVVFWYNCDALTGGNCETLKASIQTVMDDFGGVKLIAFPWHSLDVPVAMTSWGRLQRFETFDPQLATAFIEANRNQSPEPNAQ